MQHFATQSMVTMRYAPKLDRKQIGYAVSCLVAFATSTISIVAFA